MDSYQPIIDRISDRIDEMEDLALTAPGPDMLEEIFDLKRVLIQLRRVDREYPRCRGTSAAE